MTQQNKCEDKETENLADVDILENAKETFARAENAAEEKEDKKKKQKENKEIEELQKQLAEKEAQLAAENDRYLRLAAEYENFRRRSAKEREGIFGDAYGEALATIFPVLDNLERAAQFKDGESVAKGLELTLKSVGETLQKLGVSEIEALGKPFDPLLHNAVFHVDDPAFGESEIVEVLQKGYRLGDRVLRYAMVKVAN